MASRTVAMEIPSDEYDQLTLVAEQQSVDGLLGKLLLLMLNPLEMDTETMFSFIENLPDQYLGQVIHFQLTPDKDKRLGELREFARQRELSLEEREEKEQILSLIDQYMLLRSKGLVLLKERGYDIDSYVQKRKS